MLNEDLVCDAVSVLTINVWEYTYSSLQRCIFQTKLRSQCLSVYSICKLCSQVQLSKLLLSSTLHVVSPSIPLNFIGIIMRNVVSEFVPYSICLNLNSIHCQCILTNRRDEITRWPPCLSVGKLNFCAPGPVCFAVIIIHVHRLWRRDEAKSVCVHGNDSLQTTSIADLSKVLTESGWSCEFIICLAWSVR